MENIDLSQNNLNQTNFMVFYYGGYDDEIMDRYCTQEIKQNGEKLQKEQKHVAPSKHSDVFRTCKEQNQHMNKTCSTKGKSIKYFDTRKIVVH